MEEKFTAARFSELMEQCFPEPEPKISRRAAFLGLSAMIAAPFVIRTPGLLMPVRDRTIISASELEWQTILGTRDYQRYPLTVAEVKAWRENLTADLDRGIHYLWTGEGFMRIHRMAEAEKRYQAMGLL